MIAVAEAQALVYEHAQPLPAENVSLAPACLNMILAEPVVADLDMPPFTKATHGWLCTAV